MSKVLVSDFDGSMTKYDFYTLVCRHWPAGDPERHFRRYMAGEMSHFEAMVKICACARGPEIVVKRLVERMELDPGLGAAVEKLRAVGWEVVIASAGCQWYIDYLLEGAGLLGKVEVLANPGQFQQLRGLVLDRPRGSPYYSEATGIDKLAVVRTKKALAYVGDGRPDLEGIMEVEGKYRFARGWLAGELERRGVEFRRFEHWGEIAESLVTED